MDAQTTAGSARTDGASGNLVYANESKSADSNGNVLAGFDALWNLETESTGFSLVLTDTGFTWFTWFQGDLELGTSSYADLGIENTFQFGYKVMLSAIDLNQGRGTVSLDSIQIEQSGGAPAAELQIIDTVDNGDGSLTLTWNSVANGEYTIETSSDLDNWEDLQTGIAADAATKEFTFNKAGDKRFYRVYKE